MNLHDHLIKQPIRMLRNMQGWLEKAKLHAAERKFDANTLLTARLAPDQFAFARQVQIACDSAKGNASRLAHKTAPSHPDTETTLDELRVRIDTCIAYLETFGEDAFAEYPSAVIAQSWMGGKHLTGDDYLLEFASANFYFHVVTAYAILRHNGVALGKGDYLGPLSLKA